MSTLPRTHREVRLAAVATGLPEPANVEVVQAPLPAPGAGEVLVRNRLFHVPPTLRMLIGGITEGTPFPTLRVGDTLAGAAVGEVVQAHRDSALRPGDQVTHWSGWREYAAVPVAECTVVDASLPDPVAHLSQAWTAYAALNSDLGVRSGDTVLVTGGAGGIGSMAGQIARLLGARRVIGSTGSRDKAGRLVSELGYDAAVVRAGDKPLTQQLAEAAPDGVDLLFDTVGGQELEAAVHAARPGARFLLIGALSGQLAPDGNGLSAPVTLDGFQLIIKRITMNGFSADDVNPDEAWHRRFRDWLRSGQLTVPHARVHGIQHAPQAVRDVVTGDHIGLVVVEP